MNLTPEYSIVDYQSTPSGYYQVAFRSSDEFVSVTQTGRGGCNLYSSQSDAFMKWLDDNADLAIAFYRRMGSDLKWLISVIENREMEWEDHVVMAIADMIELKLLPIGG